MSKQLLGAQTVAYSEYRTTQVFNTYRACPAGRGSDLHNEHLIMAYKSTSIRKEGLMPGRRANGPTQRLLFLKKENLKKQFRQQDNIHNSAKRMFILRPEASFPYTDTLIGHY